jgi:protein-L-isoaspartate O-methyltransferase
MGFNISAPHMYAMCLEALQLQPGMSFLDVGSGCGHLTALAAVLVGTAGRSHGIDVRKDIVEFAEENVKRLREKCGVELPQLRFFVRNCFAPDPEEMHYDRIHVGACCPTAKLEYLIGLLNPGGMLVTPYGDKLIKATKDLSGAHHIETVTPGVRYGDLCVPSEAEVEAAQRALESRRAEKVTVPPNTLLEDLAKLVNNKDLSDVCFVLEGQKVYAHRLVLQLRSSHFRAMLNGGMREASMSEIVIPQCPHSIFLLLLKTLYTGEVDFVNPSNCVEILEWANYFKVDRLKAQCEDVMRLGLDVDNAGSLLTVADRFDATQLRACIMEFMLRNFKAVSVTKAFKELDPELMMKITATAVSRLMGAQRGV